MEKLKQNGSVAVRSADATATVRGTLAAIAKTALPQGAEDPTRYGDWVKNGRCIDF